MEEQIMQSVADIMTDKPMRFKVSNREFTVNFPTIGKIQRIAQEVMRLRIDEKALEEDPISEAFRVCATQANQACRVMAVATLDTKEELNDDERINEVGEFLKWNCKEEVLASILLHLYTMKCFQSFIHSTRLIKYLLPSELMPNGTSRVEHTEDVLFGEG